MEEDDSDQTVPSARYEDFFDAIDGFRPLDARDRVSDRLRERIQRDGDEPLPFNVDLWFAEDVAVRTDWLEEAQARVGQLEGRWVDTFADATARVLVARAIGDRRVIDGLAELDQIALLDAVAEPNLRGDELADLQDLARLPDIVPRPDDAAPVVGLVDSGLRAGHPLLEPAVFDSAVLHRAFAGRAEDDYGHGTAVAGLILYGDVLAAARSGNFLPPFWLASVRVLDDEGYEPENANTVRLITDAIRHLVEECECRIINLSFGDPSSPYVGGKSSALAAALDTAIRRYGLLLVVSAGNLYFDELAPQAQLLPRWPAYLTDPGFEIVDPAQAALAITVGATSRHDAGSIGGSHRMIVAAAGGPAPFTRHGPGVLQAIKPEVTADGGNWVFDRRANAPAPDHAVEVISTSNRYPGELFAANLGTSVAAGQIAHIAGLLETAYPELDPLTWRALLLQGADHGDGLIWSGVCQVAGVAGRGCGGRGDCGSSPPGATRRALCRDWWVCLICGGWVPHDLGSACPLSEIERGRRPGGGGGCSQSARGRWGANASPRRPGRRRTGWLVDERDLPAVGGQLAGDGDGDDAVLLAARGLQQSPAGVQPALGAPGGVDGAGALPALAALEGHPDRGVVAVVVGGLDEQPAGVGGAGLGDGALAALVARGALGGHQPEVGRQRVWVLEALKLADLGAQAQRRERVDAAHAAQPGDRLRPGRVLGDVCQLVLDALAARQQDVVGVQVVLEGQSRGVIVEAQPGQPAAMLVRPRVRACGEVDLTAQQELPQPLASAHQVGADVLAAAHQVTQPLVLQRRDRDERQLAGGQQPGQTNRVALVGLDAITRAPVGVPRCAHPDVETLAGRAAVEPVAGRPGLVDGAHRRIDPAQPRQQLVRASSHPPRAHLAGVLIEDRERRLVRVHVQTDPTNSVSHVGTLPRRRGPRARAAIPGAKITPRCAWGADRYSPSPQPTLHRV